MTSRATDGPFRSDQIAEGSRYELTRGHPVYCEPAGRRHGLEHVLGTLALGTDPAVAGQVGVDVGFTPDDRTLRAPDIAVGGLANEPGWAEGAPRLAVEYADRGNAEADLRCKIGELLGAGTEAVWVVRLTGPKRVEVHTRDGQRTFGHDEVLPLAGGLSTAVPVAALFDRASAEAVALRNLLAPHGVVSLDDLRAQGRAEGREQGRNEARAEASEEAHRTRVLLLRIAHVLSTRGLPCDAARLAHLATLSVSELQITLDALDATGRWP